MSRGDLELLAIILTPYNVFLWVLWSVVLPVAFIIALRQWGRFNEERRKQERLKRMKLAAKLSEASVETDFKADAHPMLNDKDRHASCLERLNAEIEMYKTRAEGNQPSPQQDNEMPPQ